MIYNIVLTSEAYLDIDDASSWYDNQVKDLGIDFVLEFYEETNSLSENPTLHAIEIKSIRKKLMRRFPYAIYFSVIEKRKEVLIEAVFHQKRNPERLKKRLT